MIRWVRRLFFGWPPAGTPRAAEPPKPGPGGHVHTIPVDPSFGDDWLEAWKELCIFGRRVTFTGEPKWWDVRCDGQECQNIEVDR